ncbi:MAG TPA: TetR/AcrR family transcriptional regulator [Polyangiaceae bacterium]|nr:TetR/AcrR family transcriptional regulator [Polyangiaceae bacterium]
MCPAPNDPSSGRKPDRRVERTKRALFEALVELMIEKGYDAISVADVADRANVGRSTFYAHYADKEDLLQESLRGLRHHLTTAAPARLKPDGPVHPALAFSLPMLLHVQEVRELFCALAGKQQGAPVQTQLHVMLADLVRETLEAEGVATAQRSALMAEAIVGAFLSLAIWWMNGNEQLSAEDVDRAFLALFTPGLSG